VFGQEVRKISSNYSNVELYVVAANFSNKYLSSSSWHYSLNSNQIKSAWILPKRSYRPLIDWRAVPMTIRGGVFLLGIGDA
jgi:hypothetical protein